MCEIYEGMIPTVMFLMERREIHEVQDLATAQDKSQRLIRISHSLYAVHLNPVPAQSTPFCMPQTKKYARFPHLVLFLSAPTFAPKENYSKAT